MDLSSNNVSLWMPVIGFGILAGLMLISNTLLRKVPFFRKSLIPTSVLAGFLLLLVRETGLIKISGNFLETVTYHGIAIGFIAMSLRIPDKNDPEFRKEMIGAKSGALIIGSYVIQALAGLLISLLLAYTLKPDMFKAAGLLLPMGYGQGPGQANNIGAIYENQFGFAGGQSFGLSIAAAGYLCACTVGVVALHFLKKAHKVERREAEVISGSVSVDTFQANNEIPISQSVDRFSIQVALVIGVYLLTYLVSWGITSALDAWAPGLGNTLNSIIWGFNFVLGSVFAILVRGIMNRLTKKKIMTRRYQNNYLLNRISGLAFDFMIICGIGSISIKDLKGLWLPFLLMAVFGCAATYFYLKKICRKVYGSYYYEGFLSMFGMMTGTISSGILLLREIDPYFETPAANNLVVGSSFAILFGAPLLLLVNLAAASEAMVWLVFGLLIVYFLLLMIFVLKTGKKTK